MFVFLIFIKIWTEMFCLICVVESALAAFENALLILSKTN